MEECEVKTVLVVEDDVDSACIMSTVMEMEGYRVFVAGSGREALGLLEWRVPDIILLDLKMPNMDGWEFARHCRTRHGAGVPIVVCTAFPSLSRLDRSWADAWLDKPFDIDDLVGIVRRTMEYKRRRLA